MALPDVTTTFQDGSLGITGGVTAVQSVSLGISEKGVVGTVHSFSDPTACFNTLGEGPLTEAVCLKLALAGGTQYAVPLTPLFDGAFSATVTKVGSGAGTISARHFAPKETITVECTTSGALGTAAFKFKLGSGTFAAPIVSAAGWSTNYQVVGTLTRLQFVAGAGPTFFEAGDVWTVSTTLATATNASVTRIGASTGHIQQTSQPLDDYDVVLYISKTGGRGVGEFRYSLDGGNKATDLVSTDGNANEAVGNYSAAAQIPSNGLYAIPNTCLVVTFANASFTLGDVHSFIVVASGFNTAAVTSGFNSLFANTSAVYDLCHVVGAPASAANAASLSSTIDSSMTTGQDTHKRYLHSLHDTPSSLGGGTIILSGGNAIRDTADTDAVTTTAYASTTSKRVGAGVGDAKMISAVSGRQQRRCSSWIAVARKCALRRSRNASEVAQGALSFVKDVFRDERTAATSMDFKFITLRTYVGLTGYYVTRGLLLADSTSDFQRQANRMVLDKAAALGYTAALFFVERAVKVNANGTIHEESALEIESRVRKGIDDVLLPNDLSGETQVTVSRTQNVLATSTIPITIRCLPFGYATYITQTIGFQNPAIAAALAA